MTLSHAVVEGGRGGVPSADGCEGDRLAPGTLQAHCNHRPGTAPYRSNRGANTAATSPLVTESHLSLPDSMPTRSSSRPLFSACAAAESCMGENRRNAAV